MVDSATDGSTPPPPLSSQAGRPLPRPSRTFTLSAAILAANLGTGIMCLADAGQGRAYRLHAERPGVALNCRAIRCDGGRVEWRADLPSGAAHVIAPVEAVSPLIMVRISGPLEQRAGYHDPCDGWSDGHDAVADRLCAAFAEGDVLLVVDSPGGAAAGLQQAAERARKAKDQHGRRVTVFADEMIGSAAMWWAYEVGDELFVPIAGQVGSIGARGQHTSIKGALDKEGVLVTYFADPPEKVCFAPERLPDEETIRRGMRDVELAATMFREAVCGSALGVANGLTPDYLIKLGADMLTGQAAVDAGLATGVESFETVVAYALALAESEPGGEARTATKTTGAKGAKGDRMSLRATNGAPPGARAEDEKKEEEQQGSEPSGKCGHCGMQNEDDAKFCDQCGKSMAAQKMEDEPPPSSRATPSSERKSAAAPPPPERMAMAPRKLSPTASLASILGATADTPTAIKTAAIGLRHVLDTAAGITGKSDAAGIVDELLAVPHMLAKGDAARAALRKQTAAAEAQEHRRLCLRYVELNPGMRSKVLADLDGDGKPYMDDKGNRRPRVRSDYAKMSTGTLATIVRDLEKDAPPPRAPWEPDARRAEDAAGGARPKKGEPSAAAIEAAKRHPTVLAALSRSGNTLSLDKLAEQHARLFSAGGSP